MPIYIYKKESTGEVREVYQGMNEPHLYFGEDGSENDWKRVFTAPNAAIDTQTDPFSSKSFVNESRAKKGTVGDLLDRSKELSEKRAAQNGGVDPVKEKYFKEYSEKRKGAKHPEQMKKFETKNISVEY